MLTNKFCDSERVVGVEARGREENFRCEEAGVVVVVEARGKESDESDNVSSEIGLDG